MFTMCDVFWNTIFDYVPRFGKLFKTARDTDEEKYCYQQTGNICQAFARY